jgi:hypothetical protein
VAVSEFRYLPFPAVNICSIAGFIENSGKLIKFFVISVHILCKSVRFRPH